MLVAGIQNQAAAQTDLAARARKEASLPSWAKKQQESVKNWADQHRPVTPGAGAGTSASAAASAAAKAKSEADKAARAAQKQERDRQKQIERYNSEQASLERDQWSGEAEFTTDIEERAELARKRVKLDAEAYTQELASKVALGELTTQQAHKLQLGKNYNTKLELDLINWKKEDDLTRQALDTTDARLTLQSDLKRGELSEAKTQAERRTLQQQLLDIEYDRQKAALESVLALNSSTQAEKDIAAQRLAQLPTLKGQQAELNRRDTAGPMEAFGDSLHRTAGQIKEDFQQIEVDGIKSLNDGLVDAIVNSKNLGEVFSNVAKQILADIIKIGLQAAESSIFGKGSGGGGGGGDFFGSLVKGLQSVLGGGGGGSTWSSGGSEVLNTNWSLPGMATGGIIKIAGNHGIDTNLMSINGEPAAWVNRGENIKVVPANDADQGRSIVELHVAPGQLFEPVVAGISGNVSVRTLQDTGRRQQRRARQRLA